MSDSIVYMRVPQSIIELADATVAAKLYSNRAEVLREMLRNGVKNLIFNGCGGFCMDTKKMVDCCHDDQCKYCNRCEVFGPR